MVPAHCARVCGWAFGAGQLRDANDALQRSLDKVWRCSPPGSPRCATLPRSPLYTLFALYPLPPSLETEPRESRAQHRPITAKGDDTTHHAVMVEDFPSLALLLLFERGGE